MKALAKKTNRRRKREPAHSRKALMEAAARLFNTAGYLGTDSNRIARAAGYAPATFYTHFPDKLAIFLEVYTAWVDGEEAALAATLQAGGSPGALPMRLAKTILDHHRKWRVFRASLRALYATDDQVHRVRLAQRKRQIESMAALVRRAGRPAPGRARMLALLLSFEVLCDAVADRDAKALGVSQAEILAVLAAEIKSLLSE
jgi:AcrR family transcriptional regulator